MKINYWESANSREMFSHLIGGDYGSDPEAALIHIIKDKEHQADLIIRALKVRADQVGAELGSGCGFMMKSIAKVAHRVYGLDISQSFLNYARAYCQDIPNVEFMKISDGDLAVLPDAGLDFLYANNVFIHLNFYTIFRYLGEIARVLKPGGRLWFDIIEIERLEFADDLDFAMTLRMKSNDPQDRHALEFNSLTAVCRALDHFGLDVRDLHRAVRCNTKILCQKRVRK